MPRRRINVRNLSLLILVCAVTLGTCAVLGAAVTGAAVDLYQQHVTDPDL